MWQLDNRTPFSAGQGWIRDRVGAETFLVVVKASFDVGADGAVVPSAEQPEPVRIPQYHGVPGESSLLLDNDFVLCKATTDVIVLGHAWAPRGRQASELVAGFRVGSLEKRVRILGDRSWGRLRPSDPLPFDSMPLVYERAFGGPHPRSPEDHDWDVRNPVGVSFAGATGPALGSPLPNLEDIATPIRAPSDRPAPAGFGPICSHWQPRASFAGTYGDRWERERQPLLPDDCDDRHFQCAPPDQQGDTFFRGGEPVELLNLNPDGVVRFTLPTVELAMESRFDDGERRAHDPPLLHTIVLEPDRPGFALVFHSALECHAKVHGLLSTRIEWTNAPAPAVGGDPDVENLLDLV